MPRQGVQRFERVRCAKERGGRGWLLEVRIDDRGGGALVEGRADEAMPVHAVAFDSDEKIPALKRPAVYGNAACPDAVFVRWR